MSKQLIPFSDLAKAVKDVYAVVKEQSTLQDDSRVKVLERQLRILTLSPALVVKDNDEKVQEFGSLGKVVTPSSSVTEKKEAVSVSIGQLGAVVNQAVLNPEPAKTDATKEANKGLADDEFLQSLVGKTVEKLASTQFSKDALLQIVKAINEKKEGSIEVVEADTKQTLAEKIYAVLNPEPATPATPAAE